MAQALREITAWANSAQTNHVYLMDGDRMLAYIRLGTQEEFWFRNPIRIDRRGRRFEPVEPNPFTALGGLVQNIQQVVGSRGQTYVVNLDDGTCSCPGYTYRGVCKHSPARVPQ